MATSVGSSGQVMIGLESTSGTAVAPTRVIPFVSENIQSAPDFLESKAIRSDSPRVKIQAQRLRGKIDPKGPLQVEIYNKGFGMFLKWAFGQATITQPAVGTDPTVYDQTFKPYSTLGTQSMTCEVGWTDISGSAFSKTIAGAMVDKFSISTKVGELLGATFDVIGQGFTVATTKTAATYPAGLAAFSWASTGSTLTLGGSSADLSSVQFDVNNNLDADRFYIGSGGVRKQPLAPQMDITGTAESDFSDWTAYNRFLNGTAATLVTTLVGSTISNAYKYQLQLTANVMTDGDTPSLSGPGRITQPLKFTALDSTAGAGDALTIVYRTTDSAV